MVSKYIFLLIFLLGCSNIQFEDKNSLNGNPTLHKDIPSMVALVNNDGRFFCSGSLIGSDIVLTAAHCVIDKNIEEYEVAYGYYNPQISDLDCLYHVSDAIIHEDYRLNQELGRWDDIALLRLSENVYNGKIAPILDNDSILSVDKKVLMAGYGLNIDTGRRGLLHSAEVPIIMKKDYEIVVGSFNKKEPNTCFGDSGGPIFVKKEDNLYVTGIASRLYMSKECGSGAIYTLPSRYLGWIEEKSNLLIRTSTMREPHCEGFVNNEKLPQQIVLCSQSNQYSPNLFTYFIILLISIILYRCRYEISQRITAFIRKSQR